MCRFAYSLHEGRQGERERPFYNSARSIDSYRDELLAFGMLCLVAALTSSKFWP